MLLQVHIDFYTLPKTNRKFGSENQWLEDGISFWEWLIFSGELLGSVPFLSKNEHLRKRPSLTEKHQSSSELLKLWDRTL